MSRPDSELERESSGAAVRETDGRGEKAVDPPDGFVYLGDDRYATVAGLPMVEDEGEGGRG